MDLLVLGAIAVAALCGSSDSKSDKACKKQNKRRQKRARRDDSWLDAAWFHDHNQNL